MSMTDPIADMLTRIRNALKAGHPSLEFPRSGIKVQISRVLKEQGFIEDYAEVIEGPQGSIRIHLRYDKSERAIIRGLVRISKPSRRHYVGKDDVPRVRIPRYFSQCATPYDIRTRWDAPNETPEST